MAQLDWRERAGEGGGGGGLKKVETSKSCSAQTHKKVCKMYNGHK